jgi:hypothetical protein
MLEPDMRLTTMDRYITASEAIVVTADAKAAVTAGRRGYGVNSGRLLGNVEGCPNAAAFVVPQKSGYFASAAGRKDRSVD